MVCCWLLIRSKTAIWKGDNLEKEGETKERTQRGRTMLLLSPGFQQYFYTFVMNLCEFSRYIVWTETVTKATGSFLLFLLFYLDLLFLHWWSEF